MKIKKLELIGFKSFVDRTVLHFDHDVLGIVGPNGCGKSNIVDAIRWCMGEQSARHLRGRSMDDVIFSGSESRSPNDFAEVTLTFENDTPGDVPIEYQQYPEIAVTRRLHRSGESDYLINKTAVRLRDVTDMFLGTGAGTKAYSIVEQGKVGLIVSAKAEDRRLLIEEAAGITKFKSRKKQAENKMQLTEQNLLRVGDIVAEIDRSLASLKRQAAKAERYIAYRRELEDVQLHEAAHRYLELAGTIAFETGEAETAGQVHERARTELAAREVELETLRSEAVAAEGVLAAAQGESFAADGAVQAEEASIARAKDRLGALTQREQQAEGESQEMSAHAARLVAERESCAVEISGLAQAEADVASRAAQEESALAAFATAHALAQARTTERRQAIATSRAEIASAEAKLAGFERRHNEMAARRDKLRLERESLDLSRGALVERSGELSASIDDLRAARASTTGEKERLEKRLAALKERIRTEEKALDESKAEVSQARSRHGALREMHARLEGVGAGAKALVSTGDRTVLGLVADRIEAPADLTQALGGLLGGRLQHVVVADIDRGAELLADLAKSRKGRATIVPVAPRYVAGSAQPLGDGADAVRLADALRFAPADEALVRALVGDALAVRDLDVAHRLRRAGVTAVVVTFDGTVLYPDGRVEGGQGDEFAAGLLESKREVRELAKQIESLDAVVSERLASLQASRAELAETGSALDRARQDAHARELALITAEKDLQKADGQLESVARRLASLTAEESDLSRSIDESGFERAEVARVLCEAGARVENAQSELADAEAALGEAVDRLEAQRHAVTQGKVAVASIREKLAAARGTDGRLARSAAELEGRAARIREELATNARLFEEITARLAVHRGDLEVTRVRAGEAAEALSRARASFEALRSRLGEGESALKAMRARVDSLRDELLAREMNLRERRMAMDHLLASVAERFRGLSLPRVVGDYHMRPPPDDALRARGDELARLVERMGSVNLDAVREHAEAEQRFTFYSTQKVDLEKALRDLQQAIQLMNRESRRLFEETFAAVNARFKEIFPRMFRGGRAELRLTQPDDALETGIDIVAQPPGKKLSSIELMSGGEKALTAVSLIFAIFQIKPSPFCILDEVDAPLDEANVARYNELVRSMTDRSQFILITHIKRTMQMVDVLYGVTMPESGVSKIVSVKVSESESRSVSASENRSVSPSVAPPQAAVA